MTDEQRAPTDPDTHNGSSSLVDIGSPASAGAFDGIDPLTAAGTDVPPSAVDSSKNPPVTARAGTSVGVTPHRTAVEDSPWEATDDPARADRLRALRHDPGAALAAEEPLAPVELPEPAAPMTSTDLTNPRPQLPDGRSFPDDLNTAAAAEGSQSVSDTAVGVEPVLSTLESAPRRTRTEPLVVDSPPAPGGASGERGAESRPRAPRRVADSALPTAGYEGRLDSNGEELHKVSIELPVALFDALSRWELSEAERTGKRVYRERLLHAALARMSTNVDDLIDRARALPDELRQTRYLQVGSRVQDGLYSRLLLLRPALRVRRVRGLYLRDLYAAAIYDHLTAVGIPVDLSANE